METLRYLIKNMKTSIKMFAFLLIFNLMSSNVFAGNQSTVNAENEIRRYFHVLLNDSKFMNAKAEAEGFYDIERKEVYIDNLKKILADRDVMDYVVNHLVNARMNMQGLSRLSVEQKTAYAVKLLGSKFLQAKYEGGAHLLPSQQLALLRYQLYMSKNVSSSSCKVMALGGVDAKALREIKRALTRMDLATLRDYLKLDREVILAGIKKDRSVSYLTKEQEEISEKLFANKWMEHLKSKPLKERNRILNSLSNLEAVSDSDACEAIKTYLEVVTRLPGIEGEWYRSKLF